MFALVKFCGPKGIFSHKVPRIVPASQLYELAFRGMRGCCPRFDLIYLSERMKPETFTGLQRDPIIKISVSETAAAQAGFNELSLIKVFEDWKPTRTSVNYWVPKNTTNTLASIIFRHWRRLAERSIGHFDAKYDVQVWTDLHYRGDGSISGTPQDEWESVSTLLTPRRATGILEDEDPYPKEEEDDPEEPSGPGDRPGVKEPLPSRPLVLKVMMVSRPSYSRRAAKRVKKSGSLTRVSSFPFVFQAFRWLGLGFC